VRAVKKRTGKGNRLFEPRPQGDASREANSEHPFTYCSHEESRRWRCLICGGIVCKLCKADHWMELHEPYDG